MKYQVIRHWNGTKGSGRVFDTLAEAKIFLNTNARVREDENEGFYFTIEAIKDEV